MAHYANQKTIHINRQVPDFKEKKQFLTAYTENIGMASRLLSGVAFKFYLYLLANKDEYELDYSPKHFANIYGVSYESAKKAPAQLEDAGYLILNNRGKLEFFEVPQEKPSKIATKAREAERRLIEQEDGEFKPMSYEEVYSELKDDFSLKMINDLWEDAEVWQ